MKNSSKRVNKNIVYQVIIVFLLFLVLGYLHKIDRKIQKMNEDIPSESGVENYEVDISGGYGGMPCSQGTICGL